MMLHQCSTIPPTLARAFCSKSVGSYVYCGDSMIAWTAARPVKSVSMIQVRWYCGISGMRWSYLLPVIVCRYVLVSFICDCDCQIRSAFSFQPSPGSPRFFVDFYYLSIFHILYRSLCQNFGPVEHHSFTPTVSPLIVSLFFTRWSMFVRDF